ncbi:MAG: shikimate kinase [Chloroflexi bacterium]|nr:shikimate kinase [Chloroflexota bacterium]
MQLVFIYGMPAVGKLTVARELEKLTGYPVFHNHLVVDMLSPVFDFGGAAFTEMRESIWLQVLARAERAGRPGLIFTFTPERTVRASFVRELVQELEGLGGKVLFVRLKCPERVAEQRLGSDARFRWDKLRSVEYYRELRDLGAFRYPKLPDGLTVDTSRSKPKDSAREITKHYKLPVLKTKRRG